MTERKMNRDTIKYIAMATMLLNHIAMVFMKPGTLLAEIFLDAGYFTAPVMCYFLVEGYGYTRSVKKYGERLLLFALISQIPFCLAFTSEGILDFVGMNMLFTLFLCFLIIKAMKEITDPVIRTLCIAGLVFVSMFSDWAILAPVFTILFVRAGNSEDAKKKAFITGTLIFGGFNFLGGMGRFSLMTDVVYMLGSMVGPAFAGICILFLYNGKRAEKNRKFSKWFFYWFYPVHLTILGLIRIFG